MLKITWEHIDADIFEVLCGDVIHACLPPELRGNYVSTSMKYRRDFQCDGLIESGGFPYLGLISPVIISCKTTDPQKDIGSASKEIKSSFLAGLNRLAERNPQSVVLFSNHDLTPEAQNEIRNKIAKRFSISFQGRKELEQHFRVYPHLLWKYFKHSWSVETFHSTDSEGLRNALLNNPLAKIIPLEKIGHPSIEKLSFEPNTLLKIIGKPGSGKSVALWQLLIKLKETEVIIIRSLDVERTWPHLQEIILNTGIRGAIIIDDLQDMMNIQQGQGFLSSLIDLSTKLNSNNIFLTYRSTKRDLIENIIEPHRWKAWGFSEVCLDTVPRTFISSIVDLTCNSLNICIDEKIKDGFIDGIIDWENTPACAVSSLLPYRGTHLKHGCFPVSFFPVLLQDRESVWQETFKSLVRQNRITEIDALKCICALRLCGIKKVPFKTFEEVYLKISGRTFSDCLNAINRLQDDGWLNLMENQITSHDVQITPETVGVVDEYKILSPIILKFLDLISKNEIKSLNDGRIDSLLSFSRFFWDFKYFDIAEQLNQIVCELMPTNPHALSNRGQCRIKMGNIDIGIVDLRNAFKMASNNIHFLSNYFYLLLEYGRLEEAQNIIAEEETLNIDNPDYYRFASEAYGAIFNNFEKSLEYAKKLWNLRKDSSSAMTYVVALSSYGKAAKARKFLEASIKRWPEDGVLYMILSKYYEKSKLLDKAIEYAEKAITFSPNDTILYADYAWLLMREGRDKDLDELVGRIRELGLKHKTLDVIFGLYNLNIKKDPQKAITYLSSALDNSQRMDNVFVSNAYLALGDALIQESRDNEAESAFSMAVKRGVPVWSCLARKGQALKIAKRFINAIEACEEAVKYPEADKSVWVDLGNLYSKVNNHVRALNIFRILGKKNPTDTSILLDEIIELIHLKKYRTALKRARTLVNLDPKDAEHHHTLGLCLGCLVQQEEAINAYDVCISIKPDHYHAIFHKAASLFKLERWSEALEAYNRSSSVWADDMTESAVCNIGICFFELGRIDEAIRHFEKAIERAHDSPAILYNYGDALYKIGQLKDAIKCYDKIIQLEPQEKHAWIRKAKIFTILKDYDNAIDSLEHFIELKPPEELMKVENGWKNRGYIGNLVSSVKLCDQILQQSPDSVRGINLAIKLKYSCNNLATALNLTNKILNGNKVHLEALLYKVRALNRIKSDDDEQNKKWQQGALETVELIISTFGQTGEVLLQKVVALSRLKRKAEALQLFVEVKPLFVNSSDDWFLAGGALFGVDAFDDALYCLDQAIKVFPEHLQCYYAKSVIFVQINRIEEAIAALNTAIAIDPNNTFLLIERGSLLCLDGSTKRMARSDFEKAIRLYQKENSNYRGCRLILDNINTNNTAIQDGKYTFIPLEIDISNAYKYLGVIEYENKNFTSAIKYLSKAVNLLSDDWDLRYILAICLVNAGQIDRARNEFSVLVEHTDQPLLHHQYTQFLTDVSDIDAAAAHRLRAVELIGDNKEEHEAICKTLIDMGFIDGASYHMKKLIELEPDNWANIIVYADYCSKKGNNEDADKYFIEALKIKDDSIHSHIQYAFHLAKENRKEEASSHFQRAWELKNDPNVNTLEIYRVLTTLVMDIGYVGNIVQCLSEALIYSKEKDSEYYKKFEQLSIDIEKDMENEGAKDQGNNDLYCLSLFNLGVLSHSRGDLIRARDFFRKAACVTNSVLLFESVLNWCALLMSEFDDRDPTALVDEINDAIAKVKETMQSSLKDDERLRIEAALRQLETGHELSSKSQTS
jgi:tetratricopeptide (TPR) repeat protein